MTQQTNITIESLGVIKQQELDLLWLIRNVYRFGTVEILIRDGVPIDIIKTIERTRLGTSDISTGTIDK